MANTQILVYSWEPKTRISELFRRLTLVPLWRRLILSLSRVILDKFRWLRFQRDRYQVCNNDNWKLKVARCSFSRSILPKFERKLRRHKQRFGKIDTTVVLDKEENLL